MRFKTQLEENCFARYIQDVVVSTLENGGSASRIDTYQLLKPEDVWRFPKYPGKTAILPPDVCLSVELEKFIEVNGTYLREPECWLGTWINPQTKHCYLDITTGCKNLEKAQQAALDISKKEGRKIVAIYNSKLEQIVYL
ncbi:MAG: hypothetical protein J7K85_09665, partial [Anaerolineaceae bacterium]|nr:hypothetical protein [Anaerolineaceae bacterium]